MGAATVSAVVAAEEDQPDVTVVVPVRNAAGLLPRLLAALDRSSFDGRWETVIVDDASTDTTAAVAEGWGARVIRLERQSGPAASRNAGLRAARAPLVAFTDADCEPSPRWLAALVEALQDADLATGPVLPRPDDPRGPFDRTLWIREESPLFQTANLAVRRALARRIGGFEPFTPVSGRRTGIRPRVDEGHFGEDAVFGWRAKRAGARATFVEEALVHHAVFPRRPREFVTERWRLRYFPALVREIPELRSALTLRFFLSEHTVLFDLAAMAAGAAVLLRRPALLVAVLPYLARRLSWRGLWRPAVGQRNAALVAADAVAMVALIRGSAAARRVLL